MTDSASPDCPAFLGRILPLTTGEIRSSHRQFISTLARLKAVWPLALLSLAVLGCAAGAFFDIRWLIAALMLVAIVAPMVMAFLYIMYALSPRCLPQVHPHRVTIEPEEIVIRYRVKPLPPLENPEEVPEEKTIEVRVPAGQIARIHRGSEAFVIEFCHPFGFARIPWQALPE